MLEDELEKEYKEPLQIMIIEKCYEVYLFKEPCKTFIHEYVVEVLSGHGWVSWFFQDWKEFFLHIILWNVEGYRVVKGFKVCFYIGTSGFSCHYAKYWRIKDC